MIHPAAGFNEAGADAPEIPLLSGGLMISVCGRFNEAGADAPEIPFLREEGVTRWGVASMRPGRMPRKYHTIAALTGRDNVLQ